MRLLVLVLLAVGCLRDVRTTPAELEAARALLRSGRPAPVRTEQHGIVAVTPRQQIDVVTTAGHRFGLALDSVMRDCPDHAPEDGRLCELHGVDHVVVGRRRDVAYALSGVLVGGVSLVVFGGVAGTIYCASECTGEGPRTASRIALGAFGATLLYIIVKHGLR